MTRTHLLTALALLGVSSPAIAQTRGPRLDVVVHVSRAAFSGDTIEIGYVMEVRPANPIPIGTLALVTPVPVIALTHPRDVHDWETFLQHGDDPMPTWAAMGPPIRAGERSATLAMRAIGVTDLVKYYVVPDIDETMKRDTIEDDEQHDRYIEWGATGTTVGIVPPPANQSPAQLAARLQGFLARSCGADNWITSRGVCTSLTGKLQRAAEAIASGEPARARPHLGSFLAELDAQHGAQPGKHVTDVAYALLLPNATHLLRQTAR